MLALMMYALLCGSLQTYLATSRPPEGGYIIRARAILFASATAATL